MVVAVMMMVMAMVMVMVTMTVWGHNPKAHFQSLSY